MSEFRRSLPRASFDLAIVGGGVHGLFAALEAARRGWKVVWSSATTSAAACRSTTSGPFTADFARCRAAALRARDSRSPSAGRGP